MSYIVKEYGRKQFRIFDTDNDEYINISFTKQKANEVARKLNLGSGFEGHMPPFFNVDYGEVQSSYK